MPAQHYAMDSEGVYPVVQVGSLKSSLKRSRNLPGPIDRNGDQIFFQSLPPGVNFINVKHTNFSYERRFGSFYYVHVTRKKLPKQCLYKKFARIMWIKLPPGQK